jgi:hypothetical protein
MMTVFCWFFISMLSILCCAPQVTGVPVLFEINILMAWGVCGSVVVKALLQTGRAWVRDPMR